MGFLKWNNPPSIQAARRLRDNDDNDFSGDDKFDNDNEFGGDDEYGNDNDFGGDDNNYVYVDEDCGDDNEIIVQGRAFKCMFLLLFCYVCLFCFALFCFVFKSDHALPINVSKLDINVYVKHE